MDFIMDIHLVTFQYEAILFGHLKQAFCGSCSHLIWSTITHTIFKLFSKTKADKIELSTSFKSDEIENMYLSLSKNT